MGNIIETSFGTRFDPKRVASGAVSGVQKQGAFFVFTVRLDHDDVREYSFSSRERAVSSRKIFIGHLEQKIIMEVGSSRSARSSG